MPYPSDDLACFFMREAKFASLSLVQRHVFGTRQTQGCGELLRSSREQCDNADVVQQACGISFPGIRKPDLAGKFARHQRAAERVRPENRRADIFERGQQLEKNANSTPIEGWRRFGSGATQNQAGSPGQVPAHGTVALPAGNERTEKPASSDGQSWRRRSRWRSRGIRTAGNVGSSRADCNFCSSFGSQGIRYPASFCARASGLTYAVDEAKCTN